MQQIQYITDTIVFLLKLSNTTSINRNTRMSSAGSSRSELESYRSFNKNNNKYINMKPLAAYSSVVLSSALVNMIKESKQMYLTHLLMHYDNVYNASFYVIMISFMELITYTLAEAHSQLSKKNLQGFILNHQAFVADIYLLYNFFTLLFMQLLVSCVLGGLYNFILPMLTENKEIKNYYVYYLIMVFSAPITSSMAIYVENIMDISREQIKSYVIKITDAMLTMILFSIFLMNKPQQFSNENLYIILAVIQSLIYVVSYARYFLMLTAHKNNKIPLKLSIRNFKPFRGVLFVRMIYQQLLYILSSSSEYINAVLVVVYTQQNYSQELYYPNMSVYIFIFIRQFTKIGKSLQLSTKRFLEAFIESNIMVNQIYRIHEILTKGVFIHLALNLVIVGVVYIMAIPVANLIYSRDYFTEDEYDVVQSLIQSVKITALCIFANIFTPFNQAMGYIYNNKFTLYNRIACIVTEVLINISLIILQIFDKNIATYINFYVAFQCLSGALNTGFFIPMLIKFLKKYKLEYSSYQPENSTPMRTKTKKKETIEQIAMTIANTTREMIGTRSLKTQDKIAETAFNNLMDGLDLGDQSENEQTIYGSGRETNFKDLRISRKSKLRAKQISIDDSFVLQKNSEGS